jgi:SAM-dependent methyltransferase
MVRSTRSIDFGRAAGDYARHRVGYPAKLFERLQDYEIGVHQQKVLDLGTGTGWLARAFARRGCEVTGVDVSEELIEEARQLDKEAKVSVTYLVARAERSGLPTDHFDVVAAGQCWHWFKRQKVAREARRMLVRGGRLAIVHFDWLPLPGTVVEATEDLILKYNRRWTLAGSTGLYPGWLTDARVAGFTDVETFSFDVSVPYSHQGWRGRVRASSGVGASMPRGKVARFDEKLRSMLVDRYPDEPLDVPHRCWAMIARRPVD